jgi:hypothetical protein
MMIELVATGFSILSRIIFMYLIWVNKSKNTISLLFSASSVMSGCCWLYVFWQANNTLLLIRTSVELTTSVASGMYIIKNKLD